MAWPRYFSLLAFFSFVIFQIAYAEIYIVALNPAKAPSGVEKGSDEHRRSMVERHNSILNSVQRLSKMSENDGANPSSKIYSYTEVMDGFSAELSEEQVSILRGKKEVRAVYKSSFLKPRTTRTYSFLGLDSSGGPWTTTNGSDAVIGVFDTGIWPEDASFNDQGYGPIPKKFKGICQTGKNFTKNNCNRKLVGARFFGNSFSSEIGIPLNSPAFPGYVSPRDFSGHGTQTASISGGSAVPKASIDNVSYGTARGMAFGARIAVYKVCWTEPNLVDIWCSDPDVFAAMDQAVLDGVDVIAIPLGAYPMEFSEDPYAPATLALALKGISVVYPGGNGGPYSESVSFGYPWALTVGASTLDRSFMNTVTLGSGATISGISITYSLNKSYPLINAASANSSNSSSSKSKYCAPGSLSGMIAKGKIVLCAGGGGVYRVDKGKEVLRAGGVGIIVYNPEVYGNSLATCVPIFYAVPGSNIGYQSGMQIATYIQNSKNPTARISNSMTMFGNKSVEAPIVTGFSAIGPNYASYQVLKPDIIAPGHSIIAASAKSLQASFLPNNKISEFFIISGTSVACPHAAGIVALVKSRNPSWTPSQIFSAIMTSASTTNNKGSAIKTSFGKPATPFAMGAGHVNPRGALDPGLVYGISAMEYNDFLCSPSGWKTCNKTVREIDLNLPSLSLDSFMVTTSTSRRLTLVGKPATYRVSVSAPAGTKMTVVPQILAFVKVGQTLSYNITVVPVVPFANVTVNYDVDRYTFGKVVWSDGVCRVAINVAANVITK